MHVPTVAGVKPIGNGVKDKDEGSKGKHSDSDSDERSFLVPAVLGSNQGNVPEIYNSVASNSTRSPNMRRKLMNPVSKKPSERSVLKYQMGCGGSTKLSSRTGYLIVRI